MIVDKAMAGRSRTYILRLVQRKGDTVIYVLAGSARESRFGRFEEELRRVMDSFRVLDGALPREMR